jgi:uncharacterized protein (TIGR03067 family)
MKCLLSVFLALFSCVTVGAAEPAAQAPALDGVWKPIAAVLGGDPLPDTLLSTITLKLSGEKYEVTVDGKGTRDKGTSVVDAAAAPKRMTIKSEEGPNKGKTIYAIFEMMDADSLRVCYDLSGAEFPGKFESIKGSSLYLVDYRRQ